MAAPLLRPKLVGLDGSTYFISMCQNITKKKKKEYVKQTFETIIWLQSLLSRLNTVIKLSRPLLDLLLHLIS